MQILENEKMKGDNDMKKTLTYIQNFDGYNENPDIATAMLGDNFDNFPLSSSTRDEEAFSERKKELMSDRTKPISNRTSLGENDRGALEALKGGKGGSFVTTHGYHIGEVKLPKGTSITAITSYPNALGKLEMKSVFIDKLTSRPRPISLKHGTMEGVSAILALMSLTKERQEEEGSTELVDTVDEILSETDMEFAPYKFSGIIYYEFGFSDEIFAGNNADTGNIEMLSLEELKTVGVLDKNTFGAFSSAVLSDEKEGILSHEDATVDYMVELNEKYSSVPRTREEIVERYHWFSLEDENTKSALRKVVKHLTFFERYGYRDTSPSMMMSGAAGTGKSTIVEVAAWLTGKDYHPYVASGEKYDEEDLIAKLVPIVNITNADLVDSGKSYLPDSSTIAEDYNVTYMDIFNAPMYAYSLIFGKEYEGEFSPDPEMLCNELAQREVQKQLQENSSDKGKGREGFMLVLNEIGQTLMFGNKVAEAQEFNMVANVNQASYYYRILEEGVFSLPTGEVFNVHDDAHIVFTMNETEGYTRPLPPAFDTRQFKDISFDPSPSSAMAAQAMTHFENRKFKLDYKQVRDMAVFMDSLREYADQEERVSFRALMSWITDTLDGESLFDSCIDTVINIASKDRARRNVMIGMLESSPFYKTDIEYTVIKDESLK